MHRGSVFATAARKDLPWSRIRTRTEDLPLFLHRLYFDGNNSLIHPWRSDGGVPPELYASVLHAELLGLQGALSAAGTWSASQRRGASALWWVSHPLFLSWKARTREAKAAEVAQQMEPFVERLFRNPRARMLGNCLRFGASPCRTLGWVDVLVQDREDAGGAPVGVPRDALALLVSGTGQFEAPFRVDLEDVLTRAAVATMLAPWLPASARFVTDINDALRTVQGGWLRRSIQAASDTAHRAPGASGRRPHRRQVSRNRSIDDEATPLRDTAAIDRALAAPDAPGIAGGFDDTMGRSFHGTPARRGVFDDGSSEADVDGDAARAERMVSPPVARRLRSTASARSPDAATLADGGGPHGAATEADEAIALAAAVGSALSASTAAVLRDVRRVIDLTNRALRGADAPYRVALGVTSSLPEPSPVRSRLALVFLSVDQAAAARRQGAASYLPYDTVLLIGRPARRPSSAPKPRIPARKPTVQRLVPAASARRLPSGAGSGGRAGLGGADASAIGGGASVVSGSRSMASRAAAPMPGHAMAARSGSGSGSAAYDDAVLGPSRSRAEHDGAVPFLTGLPDPLGEGEEDFDLASDSEDEHEGGGRCCEGGGCAVLADTACRCACPCLMCLLAPRPSAPFVARRCCDPLANARVPLLPSVVALQVLFFLVVEVAACAVACTTLLYFCPWALLAVLVFPPAAAVVSPLVGILAMAVHSAKATRLHASLNVISFLPALLGAAVLATLMAVSDTDARGTAGTPFPLILDVWLGILTPAAWLFSKFMLLHVLPNRAAAQESARDADVEVYVLRKHLASAVTGLL